MQSNKNMQVKLIFYSGVKTCKYFENVNRYTIKKFCFIKIVCCI